MAKKDKWVTVGEFRKSKRPDMLIGHITLNGQKLRVLAFLKTSEQKRKYDDPDLVILQPQEKGTASEQKEVEVPDSLFD